MSRFLNHDEESEHETGIVTRERTKVKKPKLYKVILLNDDYTPMEFVVDILTAHFNKSHQEATEVMLKIHHSGRAVCGVYPLELAETKVSTVIDEARKAGYPLQCISEKE